MRVSFAVILLAAWAGVASVRAQGVDAGVMDACRRGTPDSRIEACGKILATRPPPPREALATAHAGRCEALRLKNQNTLDQAIAECGEAVALERNNWRHYWLRGLAEETKGGQCEQAAADFAQSEKLGASVSEFDVGVFYHRGVMLECLRRDDDAIAEFTTYMRARANDPNVYRERGMAFARRGKDDNAIADFTAGLAIAPKGGLMLLNRALAYKRGHNDAKAIADLEAAIDILPNNVLARIEHGNYMLRSGDTTRAIADFSAAVVAAPKNDDAQNGLIEARRQAAAKPTTAPAPQAAPEQTASRTQAAAPPPSKPAPAAPAAAVAGGKRVALVIGNSGYKFANPLPNPANDSADIAKALRDIGFTVIEGHDLDWRGMVAKTREFSAQLDGASIALLFYAGHGVQVNGKNYLIPIDARLDKAGDLDLDAVDLQTVLHPMEQEKRVNLVFLDACRDNPFTRSLSRSLGATRSVSVSQGLAQVNSAAGTMIAFSTQPDNVAQDGAGRNSPFTTALLKYVKQPGLEVEQMMKMVRVDVMAATQEKQVPWGHSSLVGDVYLNPKPN